MPTTKPRLHIRVDFSAPWFCIMAILSFGIGYQLLMAQADIGELAGQFTDNHTYIVRMLETEWWRDHGWFTQINAPDGIILHWTFPFPALLTAFALPFWPFMDWPHAMVYGGSIIATALYLLIGLLVYRLSRYITTPGWACTFPCRFYRPFRA